MTRIITPATTIIVIIPCTTMPPRYSGSCRSRPSTNLTQASVDTCFRCYSCIMHFYWCYLNTKDLTRCVQEIKIPSNKFPPYPILVKSGSLIIASDLIWYSQKMPIALGNMSANATFEVRGGGCLYLCCLHLSLATLALSECFSISSLIIDESIVLRLLLSHLCPLEHKRAFH